MKKGTEGHNHRGTTLVEIMVAMVVLTVGVLGFIGAFGGISKSIHLSRARTIATNLAQEKIESLKNLSYYRLLVTTSAVVASEPGVGSFLYDNSYYPSETLVVGQKEFIRRVYVEKVTESGGTLSSNNWWEDDTGLKQITAYIIWEEGGEWKKFVERNLRDNPSRQTLDSTFTGLVRNSGVGLADATVSILQNGLLKAVTSGAGSYSIAVPAGTYDLQASKRGYFTKTAEYTVATSSTVTVNFDLVQMGSGTLTSTAYMNDHLVISQVAGSIQHPVSGFCQEFVEVFNPTTFTWTINGNVVLAYAYHGAMGPTIITLDYNTNSVNPSSYYLFANTSPVTVAGQVRTADAVYQTSNAGYPDIIRVAGGDPCGANAGNADTVGILWAGSLDDIDVLGWTQNPRTPPGDEGNPLNQGIGLQDGEQFVRKSSTNGVTSGVGRTYDTNDNNNDFVGFNPAIHAVRNTADIHPIVSGTPASGALVFSDDGLSGGAIANSAGTFTLTSIATGTWNLTVSSGGLYYNGTTGSITHATTRSIPAVVLSSGLEGGFISGQVVDSGNSGIPNILVTASGGSDLTDSLGNFFFQVDVGTYIVTANPANANSSYTVGEATQVVVNIGQVTALPDDIVLFQGGVLIGYVTTGTDPLPGIPIVATSAASGAEVGSYVTDSLGYFRFTNLPVGGYTFTPQLEVGETATPGVMNGAVLAGQTVHVGSMTVSNAFATITGTARAAGKPIDTGVLLVAVPASQDPISSLPPTNNSSLRSGNTYYYVGSTDPDGEYSLSVRGGTTYNIHAWYTTFNGLTPSTTHQLGVRSVTAGGSASMDFTW